MLKQVCCTSLTAPAADRWIWRPVPPTQHPGLALSEMGLASGEIFFSHGALEAAPRTFATLGGRGWLGFHDCYRVVAFTPTKCTDRLYNQARATKVPPTHHRR